MTSSLMANSSEFFSLIRISGKSYSQRGIANKDANCSAFPRAFHTVSKIFGIVLDTLF